jgi:hypothetical protein
MLLKSVLEILFSTMEAIWLVLYLLRQSFRGGAKWNGSAFIAKSTTARLLPARYERKPAVNELKAEKDAQISALQSESEVRNMQIAAVKAEHVELRDQNSAIEARLTTLESKFKKKPRH